MPRAKRGFKARRRRARIMKHAKGYYGRKKTIFRRGSEGVERAWVFSYRDRKVRKRAFRQLWITRINGALEPFNLSYSQFMFKLKKTHIGLNRKMLSELAISDPKSFETIVKTIQAAA